MIRIDKWPSRNRACTHRHDIFRFCHLIINSLNQWSHFVYNCTCDNHHIGLSRTVSSYFHSESCYVVMCSCSRHKFDSATACSKSKWPNRIRPSPINQFIKFAQYNIDTSCLKFFQIVFKSFVIFKFLSGNSFYFDIF
jgi:hypothetical protein